MRLLALVFVISAPLLGRAQPNGSQSRGTADLENALVPAALSFTGSGQRPAETQITSSTELDTLIATANASPSNSYNGTVTASVTISSPKTVPANMYLSFANSGKFTKAGSGKIVFQGHGLVDPESRIAAFANFGAGDITWAGAAYPYRLSSDLWGDPKLSTKLMSAIGAMSGKKATIVAYPGDLAAKVTVTNGLSLHLTKGVYTNSQAGAHNFTLIAQSNTRIYGDGIGQTLLYENAASARLVYVSGAETNPFDGANTNIFVEDISFMGNASTPVDSANSAVFLGNVVGGAVRRCSFENTHGFAAYVGAFSTSNNFADGVWLTDNLMKGLQTQVIGTVGGRNVHISRNVIIMSNLPSSPFAAVIDVEPNASTYGSENLQITDNIIDGRLAQQFYNGITVQKAYSGWARNLRIVGNQIIGMDNNVNIFIVTDISVPANTITLPNHGLQTGQSVSISADDNGNGHALPGGFGVGPYYGAVIVVDQNTVKIAGSYANAIAGIPVDITSTAGWGTWLVTPATRQTNGIQAIAIESSVIENNYIIGAGQNGISVTSGYGNIVRNNTLIGVGSGGNHAFLVDSVKNSQFYDNTILATPQAVSQSTDIYEVDGGATAVSTTAGSSVVTVETGGAGVPWWVRGSIITIDRVDYTVAAGMAGRIILTSNAASTLSNVSATLRLSSNLYRNNVTSGVAL
ncbi:MAG TPA: hypothetical protein VGO43_00410, partial [Pyrinomonadaceae bacterium]|nr:hypothetical protein [Pyrinomonadaceae bacterium]